MHVIGAYMVEAVPFYGNSGETEMRAAAQVVHSRRNTLVH